MKTITQLKPKEPKPASDGGPVSTATMRDYFAAAALRGGFHEFLTASEWKDYDEFAESCFMCAEAFVRERERES